MDKSMKLVITTLLILMAFLLTMAYCDRSHAGSFRVDWDHNNPIPEGYRVYMRYAGQSYDYDNPIWTGTTSITGDLIADDNRVFYVVVRAFEGERQSADSEEVSAVHWTQINTPLNISIIPPKE